MWSCKGTPLNLEKPVLGKITREKKSVISRHNFIYLPKNPEDNRMFFAGILSNKNIAQGSYSANTPYIFDLRKNDLKRLNEGDIVLLEPDGTVNQIWDTNSNHNAILATERCNSACIMCPQPDRHDSANLTNFNLELLKLLDPSEVNQIGITGGEPTLLGQDLIKLIATCKRRLPNASLSLLTNGRKFSEFEFVKDLVKVGHPDLTICVPLYADTDREHDRIVGHKGSFYETIDGIRNLALFQQKIEIRNVIHLLTYQRVRQFAEFIYHNFPFVMHIAFMGMETTGVAVKNLKKLWIDPVEYMPDLEVAVHYLHRRAMDVSVYNLQLCILPRKLWKFSRKSISDWKNIYLQECDDCDMKEQCCGFFETSGNWNSQHIKSLKNQDSVH